MAPKDKKKAIPAQEPEEPEVDEATGLRLWQRVHLRMTLEADLKAYVPPPPPTPEEQEAAAAAEAETQGKGKGKGGKGKGKAAPGGPAAKASSDPEVPARSLEVSWSSLSGQVYKWQAWEAEPNAEGAPPLTVEIDPEVEGCNPYEQPPTEIESTYSGVPKRGTYTLKCTQPLKVNETLVNNMVSSDSYIEIQLKQVTAVLAEVAEKQVEVQDAVYLDCADLLLQDKSIVKEWTDDGDPLTGSDLPHSLKSEFSRVKITLEVMSLPREAVSRETTPSGGKKPGKDKKAAAPAAPAELEILSPAVPSVPCGLMTDDLASVLNPLVIRPLKVRELPDFPATKEQIDKACYPMTVKYTFPVPCPARPTSHRGIPSAWRVPPEDDLLDDPSLRDCHFVERSVLLLGDMDIDVLEQFCKEHPLEIQVHDRDAIPVEPEFTLKNVPPEFQKPPFWYPPPPPVEESRPGSRKGTPVRKKAATPPPPEEGTVAPEPPPPEDDDDEGEVFGSAKLSLADFVKGYTKIEADLQVQPATTIRGAAGLEWNTRPGRYLQAGSELSISLRVAVPLSQMKGKDHRPKVFNRIIFLMDYKDVDLFLKIEKAVRACNIVTLNLLPPPSEESDDQGEAEEIDEIAAFQAQLEREELERNPLQEEEAKGPKPPEPPAAKITTGHLQELKVSLYVQQQLSTYRLSHEERSDPDCDVLTGVHVVDSKFRMIMLEGLQRGAMGLITMIAGWALRNRNAVEGGLQRQVLYNKNLRYPHRLFCNLGVNMWIIKIRSPLPKLVAEPSSWAQGMVREQCKEGVRRLLMLTKAVFMRQVDENNWMPTDHQLTLVDKKFGGELTREDVLGYSRKSKRKARDVGLATMIEAVASAVDSGADTEGRQRFKAALDMDNTRFLTEKAARATSRAEIDWNNDYKESIPALTETMQPIRDEWATWNPQRAAAKELDTMVKTGQLTLQECDAARRTVDVEIVPGSIPRDEALHLGWYPHDKQFLWPAPKDPKMFNAHPQKPSDSRIEELGYPWVEGEMFKPVGLRPVNAGGQPFQTIFGGDDIELFGKDPEYWKTVFISGDGLDAEIAEDKRQEEEDWNRKVVVDDIIFRAVLHNRNAGQLDRSELMLKDKPKKKGFKRNHIPTMPISMFLAEPYVENPGEDARPSVHTNETGKWMGGEDTNFQRFQARDKTTLHRIGHSQAWGV